MRERIAYFLGKAQQLADRCIDRVLDGEARSQGYNGGPPTWLSNPDKLAWMARHAASLNRRLSYDWGRLVNRVDDFVIELLRLDADVVSIGVEGAPIDAMTHAEMQAAER